MSTLNPFHLFLQFFNRKGVFDNSEVIFQRSWRQVYERFKVWIFISAARSAVLFNILECELTLAARAVTSLLQSSPELAESRGLCKGSFRTGDLASLMVLQDVGFLPP